MKYRPLGGESIDTACAVAVRLADENQTIVNFVFNGTAMMIGPGCDPLSMVGVYHKLRPHPVEARRERFAGHAAERHTHQNRMNDTPTPRDDGEFSEEVEAMNSPSAKRITALEKERDRWKARARGAAQLREELRWRTKDEVPPNPTRLRSQAFIAESIDSTIPRILIYVWADKQWTINGDDTQKIRRWLPIPPFLSNPTGTGFVRREVLEKVANALSENMDVIEQVSKYLESAKISGMVFWDVAVAQLKGALTLARAELNIDK